jgi:hypothetical protein
MENAVQSYYDLMDAERNALAQELRCSLECASDVMYLRTRNRWSPDLEQQLIQAHKDGQVVNVMEFGSTKKTQQDLLNAAMNLLESTE